MSHRLTALTFYLCAFIASTTLLLYATPALSQARAQADPVFQAIARDCNARWESDTFSPIRGKVFMTQPSESVAYRFNQDKITEDQKPAIQAMAVLLQQCSDQVVQHLVNQDPVNAATIASGTNEEISQLVRFYNGETTWSELNLQRALLVDKTRAQVSSQVQQEQNSKEKMYAEQNERWSRYILEQRQKSIEATRKMLELPETRRTTCRPGGWPGEMICDTETK